MTNLPVPGLIAGLAAFALAIFYGAWYEYARKNFRDARLLAVIAGCAAVGSAAMFFD